MTVEQSFACYEDDYRRHVDELAVFLDGVDWDHEGIGISYRYNQEDILLKITRGDRFIEFNILQILGMIRLLATQEAHICQCKGGTDAV